MAGNEKLKIKLMAVTPNDFKEGLEYYLQYKRLKNNELFCIDVDGNDCVASIEQADDYRDFLSLVVSKREFPLPSDIQKMWDDVDGAVQKKFIEALKKKCPKKFED